MSLSTVVGTMTRLQAEQFMLLIPVRERGFLFSKVSGPALGTIHPPIQWVLGFLPGGVKWPKHKAKHSPPSSARLRISGAGPLIPPVCLHGVNRDNLTFLNFTCWMDGYHVRHCDQQVKLRKFSLFFL